MSDERYRIDLSILLVDKPFGHGGGWYAHCLESGEIGEGSTQQDAIADLADGVKVQVERAVRYPRSGALFNPVGGNWWMRFYLGTDANVDVSSIQSLSPWFTSVKARVFDESKPLAWPAKAESEGAREGD